MKKHELTGTPRHGIAENSVFYAGATKKQGENDHNLHLCKMCQRDVTEPPCSYRNCDQFDYKPTTNALCRKCSKECKQYAHVTVSVCPIFAPQ